MRQVTGWRVTLPASMVQRRCQPTESGAAGCVMLAFLRDIACLTDPSQPQPFRDRRIRSYHATRRRHAEGPATAGAAVAGHKGCWRERRGRNLIQARMAMATCGSQGENRKCMVKLRTVRATMAIRIRAMIPGMVISLRSGQAVCGQG